MNWVCFPKRRGHRGTLSSLKRRGHRGTLGSFKIFSYLKKACKKEKIEKKDVSKMVVYFIHKPQTLKNE